MAGAEPWSSGTCATSSPSPRSGTSAAPPSGCTSPSRRCRSRSGASRPSSASRCSTGRRAASSSRPPARCCSSARRAILAAVRRGRRGRPPRRARRVRAPRRSASPAPRPTRLLPSLAAALRDELPGVVLDLQRRAADAGAGRAAAGRHARPRAAPAAGPRARARHRGAPLRAARRRAPGDPSARGRRGGPARAAGGRAVRHLSVALPLGRARRRRGRLRGPRLPARRGARGRRRPRRW